jgi:hypothetical protein
MCTTNAYLILVSILSGGAASSHEPSHYQMWQEESSTECTYTYSNIDSVVFDNVTLVNGLLGFKVEAYATNPFTCIESKQAETNTFLTATLGYNLFLNTVTFDPGDLVFTVDTCE